MAAARVSFTWLETQRLTSPAERKKVVVDTIWEFVTSHPHTGLKK